MPCSIPPSNLSTPHSAASPDLSEGGKAPTLIQPWRRLYWTDNVCSLLNMFQDRKIGQLPVRSRRGKRPWAHIALFCMKAAGRRDVLPGRDGQGQGDYRDLISTKEGAVRFGMVNERCRSPGRLMRTWLMDEEGCGIMASMMDRGIWIEKDAARGKGHARLREA